MVSICKSGKENSVICPAGAVATAGELWHTVTFDMATKDVHLQGSPSVEALYAAKSCRHLLGGYFGLHSPVIRGAGCCKVEQRRLADS